jgi:hypothetical protein
MNYFSDYLNLRSTETLSTPRANSAPNSENRYRYDFFEWTAIQQSIEKFDNSRPRWRIKSPMMIRGKVRGSAKMDFFIPSRSAIRSKSSRKFNHPSNPDAVKAINSLVSYLVRYSTFLLFLLTLPPLGRSTFSSRLSARNPDSRLSPETFDCVLFSKIRLDSPKSGTAGQW